MGTQGFFVEPNTGHEPEPTPTEPGTNQVSDLATKISHEQNLPLNPPPEDEAQTLNSETPESISFVDRTASQHVSARERVHKQPLPTLSKDEPVDTLPLSNHWRKELVHNLPPGPPRPVKHIQKLRTPTISQPLNLFTQEEVPFPTTRQQLQVSGAQNQIPQPGANQN